MLIVANKPIMLSVSKLDFVMLNFVMLDFILLTLIMLNVVMLNVVGAREVLLTLYMMSSRAWRP
jgi:hypothetical protein